MSLPRLMVGVLAEQDNLHAVERAQVEGVEDEPPRRVRRPPKRRNKACRTPLRCGFSSFRQSLRPLSVSFLTICKNTPFSCKCKGKWQCNQFLLTNFFFSGCRIGVRHDNYRTITESLICNKIKTGNQAPSLREGWGGFFIYGLSHCKRPSNARQKAVFRIAKHGLLQFTGCQAVTPSVAYRHAGCR